MGKNAEAILQTISQIDGLIESISLLLEGLGRILLYPFAAIAIYKLSKREKLKFPKLSLIPIINMFHLVGIIKYVNAFGIKVGGIFLSILLVLCSILRNPFTALLFSNAETVLKSIDLFDKTGIVKHADAISNLGGTVISNTSLVCLFFYLLALHKLWEMYMPKSATCYLILATLFPWMVPILLFRIRNKKQVTSKLVIDYDSDGIIDEEISVHEVEKDEAENVEDENIEVENSETENIETEVKSDKKKKKLFSFRKNK